jgi:hypothetical protein
MNPDPPVIRILATRNSTPGDTRDERLLHPLHLGLLSPDANSRAVKDSSGLFGTFDTGNQRGLHVASIPPRQAFSGSETVWNLSGLTLSG